MGLKDLVDEKGGNSSTSSSSVQRYSHQEYDEKLWNWYQELRERFPIEMQIDFIDVSPQFSSTESNYYSKEREDEEPLQYIRIQEGIWRRGDWYVRQLLLHELVNHYFDLCGEGTVGAGRNVHKWVCGKVGASIKTLDPESDEWDKYCSPFLNEEENLTNEVYHPHDVALDSDENSVPAPDEGVVEPQSEEEESDLEDPYENL